MNDSLATNVKKKIFWKINKHKVIKCMRGDYIKGLSYFLRINNVFILWNWV